MNSSHQFTREVEENGKLSFLDYLISRETTHYGQQFTGNRHTPTDYWTSHPTTRHHTKPQRRAQLVCNTTDSLSEGNKYLDRVFSKNNYNEDLIRRNTHRPTSTTTEANDNATLTTTATIPYLKGISENISRILQPFNIRVAYKPITTLCQ